MADPMHEKLKMLLWTEWDPIGVSHEPGAFGEYDTYAGRVWSMFVHCASSAEIAAYLALVQTELMGLSATPDHNDFIAKKALVIWAALP